MQNGEDGMYRKTLFLTGTVSRPCLFIYLFIMYATLPIMENLLCCSFSLEVAPAKKHLPEYSNISESEKPHRLLIFCLPNRNSSQNA